MRVESLANMSVSCIITGMLELRQQRETQMKIKEGDVLVCTCDDCKIELTVTKACTDQECGCEFDCDIDASCCGEPMVVKAK